MCTGINDVCKERDEWKARAEAMFHILDDIDTTGDMAKSDDEWYRKRVEWLQSCRWEYANSITGYDDGILWYTPPPRLESVYALKNVPKSWKEPIGNSLYGCLKVDPQQLAPCHSRDAYGGTSDDPNLAASRLNERMLKLTAGISELFSDKNAQYSKSPILILSEDHWKAQIEIKLARAKHAVDESQVDEEWRDAAVYILLLLAKRQLEREEIP